MAANPTPVVPQGGLGGWYGDEAGALARLADMAAANKAPVIPADTLARILADQVMPDSVGRWPTDPAFAADRWDLNRAASMAWSWKAGQVAGDFSFSADGLSASKGDVLAHFAEREAFYAAKAVGTTTVRGLVDPRDYGARAPDLLP